MFNRKNIQKNIDLYPKRTLYDRRVDLLNKITDDNTYLPKSIMHEDLDRGFLDFIKDEIKVISNGKQVPLVDTIITTQNWSQFVETWNFQDLDKNINVPFMSIVRDPSIKFGTNPSTQYTIPDRREFYYASVPTWDGNRMGVDVYKIPQPIPVDITYKLNIVCNRMEEINYLNKKVLQKFSSRQSYTIIKGHYIPIVWQNITDSGEENLDKRRYYVQTYDFLMMGFLIDEEEFEVSPGITRTLQLYELETKKRNSKKDVLNTNPDSYEVTYTYPVGINTITKKFPHNSTIKFNDDDNVDSYDVYVNDFLYGTNKTHLDVNINDNIKIIITKKDNTLESFIKLVTIIS